MSFVVLQGSSLSGFKKPYFKKVQQPGEIQWVLVFGGLWAFAPALLDSIR